MTSDEVFLALTSFAVFGFTGSLHCLGMFGTLAAASCRSGGQAGKLSRQGLAAYALTRTFSYGILGFAAGLLGAVVLKEGLALKAHVLALLFASLMLLWALFDLVRGLKAVRSGKKPVSLAQSLQSDRPSRFLPRILSLPIPSSIALGAATAVLPCGFLAAAYLQAAILGHPVVSAAAMMMFAIVTSPALLGGAFANLGIQKLFPRYAPLVGSLLLIAASLLLIFRAFPSSGTHHHHHGHGEQQEQHH